MPKLNTNKKKSTMKPTLLVSIALGIGAVAVYYIKTNQHKPNNQRKEQNNMSASTKPLVKAQRRGITSDQLAKAKNVPVTQERGDGKYSLVAVIEGGQANAKLSQAINVINVQRKSLANLKQQFNVLPINAQQQRELIAGEINKTEVTLKQNVSYMQANYAYTLQNQYLLVPEKAKLTTLNAEDQKYEDTRNFDSFDEYEAFQKDYQDYQVKLNNLLTEWAKDQEPNEKGQKVIQPEQIVELKKSNQELVQLAKLLDKQYSFDVEGKHNIQFEKSALYVKTEQK